MEVFGGELPKGSPEEAIFSSIHSKITSFPIPRKDVVNTCAAH